MTSTKSWSQTTVEQKIDKILKSGLENPAEAIAKLGPEAVPALLVRIRSNQNTVTAIKALGEIGDHRAIPVLVEFIETALFAKSYYGIEV